MNKKQKLVFGVSIVALLLGYLSLNGVASNTYEVSEVISAKENLTNKTILVNGTLVAGSDKWNALDRTFTFDMTDGKSSINVNYTGEKPDIPPGYTNIQVVATGIFNGNEFVAYKLLTKCPSKYEANSSNIGK